MSSRSNSNLSNNNLPLNNLHLNHLQEDCLQQQEHKHKLLHCHPPPQLMESGTALHLEPSLEIKARATNSSENSSSTGCSMKIMKQ